MSVPGLTAEDKSPAADLLLLIGPTTGAFVRHNGGVKEPDPADDKLDRDVESWRRQSYEESWEPLVPGDQLISDCRPGRVPARVVVCHLAHGQRGA